MSSPKKGGYQDNEIYSSKNEYVSKITSEKMSPLKEKGSPMKNDDDPDRPKNAVSTKITKNITIKNGKKTTIEKKIYTLADGSTQIVENETIEEEK